MVEDRRGKDDLLQGQVSCQVCRREVPRSLAQSREGSDYLYYFCGAECVEEWQQQEKSAEQAREKGR
jgi:YHS domain-containing protein